MPKPAASKTRARVDVRSRPGKDARKNAGKTAPAPSPRTDNKNAFADFCRAFVNIMGIGPDFAINSLDDSGKFFVLPPELSDEEKATDQQVTVYCMLAVAEIRRLLRRRGICQPAIQPLLFASARLFDSLEGPAK